MNTKHQQPWPEDMQLCGDFCSGAVQREGEGGSGEKQVGSD